MAKHKSGELRCPATALIIIGEGGGGGGGGGAVRFKKKKEKKKKKTGFIFGRKTYLGQSKFCITILRIVIYTNKKTRPRRDNNNIQARKHLPAPPLLKFIHLFIYLSWVSLRPF